MLKTPLTNPVDFFFDFLLWTSAPICLLTWAEITYQHWKGYQWVVALLLASLLLFLIGLARQLSRVQLMVLVLRVIEVSIGLSVGTWRWISR